MSGMKQRVVSALIFVPSLIVIVLIPYANHLAFALAVIAVTYLGSKEFNDLLSKEQNDLSIMAFSGIFLPIAQYAQNVFFPNSELTFYILMFLICLTFIVEIFRGAKDDFRGTWERNSKTVLNIIYPGLFASFLVKLCFFEHPVHWMLLFFALVCGSDTFAFLIGMAFGRNNKGIIKASPNKSVAGFIGALAIPALIGMGAAIIFSEFHINGFLGFLLGLITSFAGCVGDLIESTFKRAASVKDSGKVVMGRGGIMDTIDSIIMAAPVYCFLHFIAFSVL